MISKNIEFSNMVLILNGLKYELVLTNYNIIYEYINIVLYSQYYLIAKNKNQCGN